MARTRVGPLLPAWLWLGFPPLLLVVIATIRVLDPGAYSAWVDGERGLIELATPLVAFAAAVSGALLLADLRHDGMSKLMLWAALLTLSCLYLAGEELSWGQHLLGWETPEALGRLNDQNETNLHNMSSWLDQKPRLLLELWVLIGGIVMPLRGVAGGRRLSPDVMSSWFWPTLDCLPTAVLAILVRLPERIKEWSGMATLPYEIRYSEPQEYYFALFLLIYLAALRRRLRQARA